MADSLSLTQGKEGLVRLSEVEGWKDKWGTLYTHELDMGMKRPGTRLF